MGTKQRGTFVVRYWRLGEDDERVAIEHVQSGARTLVASFGEAQAWITAQIAAPTAAARGAPQGMAWQVRPVSPLPDGHEGSPATIAAMRENEVPRSPAG